MTTRLLAWDDRAFFLQQTPRCMAAHSRPVDSGSRPLVASGHRLAACAAHAPGFRKKRHCRLAARRGALRSGHRPRPRHSPEEALPLDTDLGLDTQTSGAGHALGRVGGGTDQTP